MRNVTDLECFSRQCDEDVWAPDTNDPQLLRLSRTVDGNTKT